MNNQPFKYTNKNKNKYKKIKEHRKSVHLFDLKNGSLGWAEWDEGICQRNQRLDGDIEDD